MKRALIFLTLALMLTACTPADTVVLDTDAHMSDTSDSKADAETITVTDEIEVTDEAETKAVTEPPETTSEALTEAPSETTAPTPSEAPSETTAPIPSDTMSETTSSEDSEPTETAEQLTEAVPAERPTEAYSYDTVYLTFDDGPGRYTEQVLEVLDRYNVKATFFVVGNSVEKYPEKLKLIADAGHAIGAHSMTHEYRAIYASGETIAADLLRWEQTVSGVIGYVPKERLYRFPGGSNCTAIDNGQYPILRDALHEMDYRAFDWTFANNDKYTVNKREDQSMEDFLKESVISSISLTGNRKIMLLHETTAETVNMLGWLIEYLQGEGYKLMPLTYKNAEYTFAK